MNMKEAYKQKVEAELDLAQAKLAEMQARVKTASLDTHNSYYEQVSELERKYDTAKVRLKELGDASDTAWEHLKDGVENAWESLSASIRDTTNKFKA